MVSQLTDLAAARSVRGTGRASPRCPSVVVALRVVSGVARIRRAAIGSMLGPWVSIPHPDCVGEVTQAAAPLGRGAHQETEVALSGTSYAASMSPGWPRWSQPLSQAERATGWCAG